MGTNPSKPVICYGMYWNDAREYGLPPYVSQMAVTSFSRLSSGTVMAHGHDYQGAGKISVHRQAEGMRFYTTREAMEQAVNAARFVASDSSRWTVKVDRLRRELEEATRARRIEIERCLNESDIQPIQLEQL